MGFWNGSAGVKLTDDMVRSFRRQYAKRLAEGENRIEVEKQMTSVIGNSRESVRMMLRGESYRWVDPLSENERAAATGVHYE